MMGLNLSEAVRERAAAEKASAERAARKAKFAAIREAEMQAVAQPIRVRAKAPSPAHVDTLPNECWVVDGAAYVSAAVAAVAVGVSKRTLQNWCNGYTRHDGVMVPPRENCRGPRN